MQSKGLSITFLDMTKIQYSEQEGTVNDHGVPWLSPEATMHGHSTA